MKKPKFAIVVSFEIHPEHVEAFTQRVLQQARDSVQLEEGCHQFDVLVDEQDANTLWLYETYDDAAAFDAHRETEHFEDFSRVIADWVKTKTVRRLHLLENAS